MTVSAKGAISAVPTNYDNTFVTVDPSTLSVFPGDWIAFSGQAGIAVDDSVAYWKASGVGIALEGNPTYDNYGRQVYNSALLVARKGTFFFPASFSGQPNLGVLVFPDVTGSGIANISGASGRAPTWGTANPVSVSGGTGAAPVKGVGVLTSWDGTQAVAGTGMLGFTLWDRNGDYY